MRISRRELWIGTTVSATILLASANQPEEPKHMYGLINKLIAIPDERDRLIAILQASSTSIPGCLSYVIAKDQTDANAIWITEVWESEAHHQASLSLPAVKDAIGRAKSIIGGFARIAATTPVAGIGPAR